MKRLFKGAIIITVNENFDIIHNGMLGIQNNEIAYVGPYSSKFEKEFDADSIIHANNKVLMPGLVNMHTHLPMTLFRGYGGELPLDKWLFDMIIPAEGKMTSEDIQIGAKLAVAEMMLSGTTTCLDMYTQPEKIADIILDSGMRAILSSAIVAGESIDKTINFFDYCKSLSDSRIRTMAAIDTEYTNDETTIKSVVDISTSLNKKIHIHISETQKEVDDCIKRTNMTPVAYLESLGLFSVGVVAVHCVAVTDDDIDILKKHNANVVYCPTSNAKLASGFAPVGKMIDKGINVCIGTDGASSNNNLDMLEEMHIGSVIAKCSSKNSSVMNARETIKMATINGAKALGIDNAIGSLEVDKKADIIMFNHNSPFFLPENELCNNLVYSASRSELEMTMIDGKILMERGKLIKYSYEELANEFEKSVAKLTT